MCVFSVSLGRFVGLAGFVSSLLSAFDCVCKIFM